MFKIVIDKRLYISGKGRRAALTALTAGGFTDVNTQCIFYIICHEYHKGLPRLAVTRNGNSQRVIVCLGSQILFRRRVYCEPGKLRKAIASSFDMCALEYLTEGHTAPLTKTCTTVIYFIIVFVEKALLCTLGPLGAIVFLLSLLRHIFFSLVAGVSEDGGTEGQGEYQRQQQTDQFFHHTFLSFPAKRVRFSPLKR